MRLAQAGARKTLAQQAQALWRLARSNAKPLQLDACPYCQSPLPLQPHHREAGRPGAALVALCFGLAGAQGPTAALALGAGFAALASLASFARLYVR